MRKLLTLVILVYISNHPVYANSDDKPPSYEKMYSERGYTSPHQAISSFESHFNKELELPLRLPPLAFTHHIAKFKDLEGNINDSLEIELVNDQHPEDHYKIDVRPAENGITINEKEFIGTFELETGNAASYIKIGSPKQVLFHALLFQRDGWQYILSIDKRVTNVITPEVLVEIANPF